MRQGYWNASGMFFYQYFAGLGRDDLADAFASADPFAISPAEIVDRVITLGCTGQVEATKILKDAAEKDTSSSA